MFISKEKSLEDYSKKNKNFSFKRDYIISQKIRIDKDTDIYYFKIGSKKVLFDKDNLDIIKNHT